MRYTRSFISYEMVCEAMDTFYVNAGKLRLSMGLPEKEFVVEIIPEESESFYQGIFKGFFTGGAFEKRAL